jgi:hypothetical protein
MTSLEGRVARLEQAQWQLGPPGFGACIIEWDFTVTDSVTHVPISGATVDVLDSLGAIVATGTTNGAGEVTLFVFKDDTYSYTVTETGYTSAMASLSGTCGDIVAVPVALAAIICVVEFDFTVTDAQTGSPIAGAATGITDIGSITSCTTNGSGNCAVFASHSGTFHYGTSATGYVTAGGTMSGSCGGMTAVPVALGQTCSVTVTGTITSHPTGASAISITVSGTDFGGTPFSHTGFTTLPAPYSITFTAEAPLAATVVFSLIPSAFVFGTVSATLNCGSNTVNH